MILSFTVPGQPLPSPRARTARTGHHYMPASIVAYKRLVAQHARAALSRTQLDWPLDAQYQLRIHVTRANHRRFDHDRILNAVCDALSGVLYVDDQAKYLRGSSVYVTAPDAQNPRITVTCLCASRDVFDRMYQEEA